MCESVTLEQITHAARHLPESAAIKALSYLEDLLDIEEANRRVADPQPAIPLERIIHEFDLED